MKAPDFDQPTLGLEVTAPLTVLNFGAHWCGLCRMVDPLLNRLATEWAGAVEVIHVNVEDHFRLAHRYGVKSLPTLVLLHNGQEVQRLSHFSSREDLLFQCHQWLDPYLSLWQQYLS
ncbi:MAG: thioredoxin family protein [Thermostichales cyanobacterium DRC_bins_46]